MSEASIKIPEQDQLQSGLLNNVALAVGRDGCVQTAMAMLRRALALNPLSIERRINLASVLVGLGEDDEAESLIMAVLARNDKIDAAWQILGVIMTHRGRLDGAVQAFERAYSLSPGNPHRKFDLAAAYLRSGDFARGLPFYEFRGETLPRTAPPPDAQKWNGEKTGHLAIYGDQGYGDCIMFSRFLPWAKERADKVTFLYDPAMVPLLQGFQRAGVCDVLGAYDPNTKFDHQICLASIPLVYGLTPDNIPPDPGLLMPADSDGSHLSGAGLKIGIAWQGNRDHPNDNIRSVPFPLFLQLANDPRNDLYSLQCGKGSGDVSAARAQRIVGDMSGMIEGEWAHTAAVIKSLDLVVTVDTAIAHLAGALGVSVFLMIPVFSDWRWLWGRDDTPWYPSMRLFRQKAVGDWAGVMTRVCGAVTALHSTRSVDYLLAKNSTTILTDPHAPGTSEQKEPDVAGVMRKVLRPGDCFIDVGANIGMHTLYARKLVGETGKILAFEPGSNNLPALREAVSGFDNVQIIEQPVWCTAEEVTFHLCAEGGGGDALWDPGEFPSNAKSRETHESYKVMATTLDMQLYGRPYILEPRLIKIDTEGADQRVLEGARQIISDFKPPFIITELHEFGLNKLGCSQGSLRKLMLDAGYSTFLLFADGTKPRRVPDDQLVTSQYIVNLLFSTQEIVDATWGAEPTSKSRPMFGYRPGTLTENIAADAGEVSPSKIKLSPKSNGHAAA